MKTGNQNKAETTPATAKETYNLIGKKLQEFYRDRSPIEMADEDGINGGYIKLANKIVDLLDLLHVQSAEEDFYWTDGPLSVYINTVEERLLFKKQKDREPGLTMEKMLFREYMHLDRINPRGRGQRYLGAESQDLDQYVSLDYQPILNGDRFRPITEKFEAARIEKKEYVIDYLQKMDKEIGYENGQYFIKTISAANPVEIPLDLSDTKSIDKIIYLHELGILELLQNSAGLGYSINGIATIVSAITGMPVSTAQSYLNPVLSTSAGQKNNPLNSPKRVTAVKQIITRLGFKPTK